MEEHHLSQCSSLVWDCCLLWPSLLLPVAADFAAAEVAVEAVILLEAAVAVAEADILLEAVAAVAAILLGAAVAVAADTQEEVARAGRQPTRDFLAPPRHIPDFPGPARQKPACPACPV